MKTFTYQTSSVCAQKISFALEDGKIYDVKFFGGCPGHTAAVSKLIQGADAAKVAALLKGNDCRGKGTSCADQLALGIEQALSQIDKAK